MRVETADYDDCADAILGLLLLRDQEYSIWSLKRRRDQHSCSPTCPTEDINWPLPSLTVRHPIHLLSAIKLLPKAVPFPNMYTLALLSIISAATAGPLAVRQRNSLYIRDFAFESDVKSNVINYDLGFPYQGQNITCSTTGPSDTYYPDPCSTAGGIGQFETTACNQAGWSYSFVYQQEPTREYGWSLYIQHKQTDDQDPVGDVYACGFIGNSTEECNISASEPNDQNSFINAPNPLYLALHEGTDAQKSPTCYPA